MKCHTCGGAYVRRSGFSTDARLELKCVIGNLDILDELAQKLYPQGWRLVGVGAERTTFLIFASEDSYLCFERPAATEPKDTATTLPQKRSALALPAAPAIPPACKHLVDATRVRTRSVCELVPEKGALLSVPAMAVLQLEGIYEDGTAGVSGRGGGRGSIACSCLEVAPVAAPPPPQADAPR